MANNPIAIDASDLQYYDKQIKAYIEDKDAEVKASLSSSLNDLKEEINKISNKADLNESAIKAANVHIDENEAAILILQNDDKIIRDEIADLRVHVAEEIDKINTQIANKLDESAMEYLVTKGQLEGLASEEFVKDKIREAQLESGNIDLSDYAKVSDIESVSERIDDQNSAITAIHTEIDNVQNNLEQYITESELAARNYATLDKLESYATKDYVTEVISNIPEVDLSNYATKEEIEAVQNVAGSNSVKIFAVESEIFDINEKLETIPSIEGLASEQFVLDKISEIEIPEVPTKVSELENDAGYVTKSIFVHDVQTLSAGAYFTNDFTDYLNCETDKVLVIKCGNSVYDAIEVHNQFPDTYILSFLRSSNELVTITLTMNEDLGTSSTFKWRCEPHIVSKLATEQFVKDSIDAINIPEIDLSNYYNKEEVNELIPDISNFATKDDLNNLATVEYITNNYISNTEAENFATHTELEEAVTEIVDTHFEETVIVHVDEEIEKKLAENQTINYGTFGEV